MIIITLRRPIPKALKMWKAMERKTKTTLGNYPRVPKTDSRKRPASSLQNLPLTCLHAEKARL